jgi:hypothetical protein
LTTISPKPWAFFSSEMLGVFLSSVIFSSRMGLAAGGGALADVAE